MTSLRLENCTNCCMLPSLGQLPALKKLYIIRLESVVSVGDEFLKGDNCASMIPFPSLEYLHFSRMASWEQWHSINTEAFPKLQLLTVSFCNKLAGSLPLQLLSLETLEIKFCSLFSSCIPKCPKLQNLHAFKSGNMVWQEQELPPLLCTLDISGCWMLESMLDSFAKRSHLQQLTISDCSNISPSSMIHLPPLLQELNVQWCKNVDFVMSPTAPLQNLQSIHIGGCVFLKFISDDMKSLLPSLRKLSICGVDKMEEFPEGILVPSLRELHIEWCNMEFILSHQAAWHLLSNITYLRIFFPHDSHVNCFPEGCSLPSTLTTLELNSFGNLETLNCTGLQHLTSLQCLNIKSCPKLEKMLGEKLPVSLKKLHIQDCLLLEEKYRNKDEQLLRQISHIPLINSSEI
ncbi:putative disease resistance protein At3g14460 [Neltuma alba]|uniref:putative disease resistance protein At3g14460 n=1 Tax=Neltuma alba TaxID=207710 RepID=UPI0010A5103E|nr:putative disease resistance protein At3g14460 [Prosopis alba]